MPALTLTPAWLWIGAHPVGEAVAHAVEVVRRNGRSLGHGGLRGGGYAVAVADDRPLVLRHDGDDEGALELQRDGGNELRKKNRISPRPKVRCVRDETSKANEGHILLRGRRQHPIVEAGTVGTKFVTFSTKPALKSNDYREAATDRKY